MMILLYYYDYHHYDIMFNERLKLYNAPPLPIVHNHKRITPARTACKDFRVWRLGSPWRIQITDFGCPIDVHCVITSKELTKEPRLIIPCISYVGLEHSKMWNQNDYKATILFSSLLLNPQLKNLATSATVSHHQIMWNPTKALYSNHDLHM